MSIDDNITNGIFTELFNYSRQRTQKSGLLDNLTFAVKDTIDIQGYRTSCCNPTWRDTHFEAPENAICVDQLLYSGAECLGKTNCGEFGCGLTGVNKFFGTPINPKTPNLLPGGSSSGSAVAVAQGLVDFALGTDAGGSIRIPASYCGIYGMRPSQGLISLSGVNSLSSSFDTIGVFANNPKILTKVMLVLLAKEILSKVSLGTIFVLTDCFKSVDNDIKPSLENTVNLLKKLYPGKIKEIQNEAIDYDANDSGKGWSNTFRTILCGEIWSTLGTWVNQVGLEFGKTTHINFSKISKLNREEITLAMYQREKQFLKLNNFLFPNNLICIPTVPHIAPERAEDGNITRYERFRPLLSMSCIGKLPQISLPLCEHGGASVGVSLIAAYRQDSNLLSIVNDIYDQLPKEIH